MRLYVSLSRDPDVGSIWDSIRALMLGLTFGPCIFGKVLEIVRNGLEAARLMLMGAECEPMEQEGSLLLSQDMLRRFDEQK